MKITLSNAENYQLIGRNSDDKTITLDGSKKIGGNEDGFRPMELVLAAIGSCSSMDVISILKKYRKPYRNYQVSIESTRKDATPSIFENIDIYYSVDSEISTEQFERAVELALFKYCSVTQMLIKEVKITHHCKVNPLN